MNGCLFSLKMLTQKYQSILLNLIYLMYPHVNEKYVWEEITSRWLSQTLNPLMGKMDPPYHVHGILNFLVIGRLGTRGMLAFYELVFF
jgi:hypothetical protein